MDKDTQITGSNVPIGYMDEIEGLMLLDDEGQPVGIDQPGEIVVKSRYLVPGYWRNPDLTRARFLPDPDSQECLSYLSASLRQTTQYHICFWGIS